MTSVYHYTLLTIDMRVGLTDCVQNLQHLGQKFCILGCVHIFTTITKLAIKHQLVSLNILTYKYFLFFETDTHLFCVISCRAAHFTDGCDKT